MVPLSRFIKLSCVLRAATTTTAITTAAAVAAAVPPPPQCSPTFEGRIPQNATSGLFVTAQSPFNPKYVLGQNVTWDQVISFPDIGPSRFDAAVKSKPIEVEITDRSIFASSSEGAETALRRSELLINNKPSTVSGRVTWFISLRTSPDPQHALNYSHEYVLGFQEAQDYQADFWSLKTGVPMQTADGYGSIIGYRDASVDAEMLNSGKVLYVQGWKWAEPVQTYFLAPFSTGVWHNFGLYLDYDGNQMQVLYSTGNKSLEIMTPLLANNLSGKAPTTLGETHIGIQKRPVGANLTSFLYDGVQEFGIKERLVLGGIWQMAGHPKNCSLI